MNVHSCILAPHLKETLSAGVAGKYGRMFPDLPLHDADETALLGLGRAGSALDAGLATDREGRYSDNPRIPAGFTYFGQLIAHDITADRSLLQHHASVSELRNFRTPGLDLESMYASGPSGTPYLYDMHDPDKFLLGLNDVGRPDDLPRNHQGRALIGDPRDDVHLVISQMHLLFLKFHNRVVDYVRAQGVPAGNVFSAAQQLVRWHYQWIVIHEFLKLTVGEELVEDILASGFKFYSYVDNPAIPIEFADAAYRYGHSQVRPRYVLNDSGVGGQIFPDLAGVRPVPAARVVDWRYFFHTEADHPPQPGKRIDTLLVHPLIDLPEAVVGTVEIPEHRSLAVRDLQRARALDMPSGEEVARAMGVEPLTPEECGLVATGWTGETPLWYYVLKEAEVHTDGRFLGPVGGRIVAEVLIGLIAADADSYLGADSEWRPVLPAAQSGCFTMADLIGNT